MARGGIQEGEQSLDVDDLREIPRLLALFPTLVRP